MINFRFRSALAAFVLVAAFGCPPTSLFASILITSAYTGAYAREGTESSDLDDSYASAGSFVLATLPGFSSAHGSVYNQSGIYQEVAQVRKGGQWDYSVGVGLVIFTAQDNDTYAINGSFNNSGGFGFIEASLFDYTLDQYIYIDSDFSNEAASLSLENGSGSLIAGRQYQWWFKAYTYAQYGEDSGAEAFGSVSFSLDGGAVPEPSSLLIWGVVGLVGLSGRRRKVC